VDTLRNLLSAPCPSGGILVDTPVLEAGGSYAVQVRVLSRVPLQVKVFK
jgi:hypothetical protein